MPAASASVIAGRTRSARRFASPYDFDTETDGCVTVRDRDTMEQIRMPIEKLADFLEEKENF